MNIQTIDQKLAARAYTEVSKRVKSQDAKEYKTFAKQFPALIHTCGLCQAVVFAQSKKGDASSHVLDDFVQILEPQNTTDHFVSTTRSLSMLDYTVLSRRAMRAAEWLKRQADALIEGD
ncbi:MAG: type III-B CRISPR module-associated protein Cmr5 [Planctomycetaceae bacterium]|nr:type III-B CRISPR module-associated protein Cmr5 [Planctomycetaceae bacterium]